MGDLVSQPLELSLTITVHVPGFETEYVLIPLRIPGLIIVEVGGPIIVYETAPPPKQGEALVIFITVTDFELQPTLKFCGLVQTYTG